MKLFEFLEDLYFCLKPEKTSSNNQKIKFISDGGWGTLNEEEIDVIQRGRCTIYRPKLTQEEFEDLQKEDLYQYGGNWFCVRCGTKLEFIDKTDKNWGYLWKTMAKYDTEYYLCPNKNCCHSSAPLVLHHPIHGHNAPAGDSYSLSWVK